MAGAEEVMRHVDAGLDAELDKLIEKLRQEQGCTRMDALVQLLPAQEGDMPNTHDDETPERDKLTLTISIEGSELRGEDDLPDVWETGMSRMLRRVADELWNTTGGVIKDINGNTVGSWEVC